MRHIPNVTIVCVVLHAWQSHNKKSTFTVFRKLLFDFWRKLLGRSLYLLSNLLLTLMHLELKQWIFVSTVCWTNGNTVFENYAIVWHHFG